MEANERHTGGRRRRRLVLIVCSVVAVLAVLFLARDGIRKGLTTAIADSSSEADSVATAGSDSTGDLASAEGDGKDDDGKDGEEEEDKPIPVEVADVVRQDIPAFFSGTATLEVENDATIIARSRGQVVRLHVEEGIGSRRGNSLELDGGEQRIALEERTADVENLKHEMNRQKVLFDRNLGSESDYISTKAQFESAEARRRAAELSFDFTRVLAPFDGLVTERMVGLGDHTSEGAVLFHLVNPEPLLARVYMPEREVMRIERGQPVRIVSDADRENVHHGQVSLIAPVVDRRTGTVKVTVQLEPRSGSRLLPGSFVRVMVETDRHPDALTVSERAIVEQGGETFVFRVEEENLTQRVRVETGYIYDNQIEILSGLEEGQTVVTAGQSSLKNDSEIRIIDDEEADRAQSEDTGSAGEEEDESADDA